MYLRKVSLFKVGLGPWGFTRLRLPDFQTIGTLRWQDCSQPPLPPGNIPDTHFCQRLSMAERITSIKNSDDTTGNRSRDLPAYSAVPPPTAPPHRI